MPVELLLVLLMNVGGQLFTRRLTNTGLFVKPLSAEVRWLGVCTRDSRDTVVHDIHLSIQLLHQLSLICRKRGPAS